MRFLRLATLVLGVVALQLSLVGDGVAYLGIAQGQGSAAHAHAGARALMAGMTMPAAGAQRLQGTASHAPSPAPRPCEQSGAPQSCQLSASCAPTVVVAVGERVPDGVPASRAPVLTVLAPASLALPPELPPPRA